MNIEKKEFLRILEKYRMGKASHEEEQFLHAYYNLFEINEDGVKDLSHSAKEALKADIQKDLKSQIAQEEKTKIIGMRFYIQWASVAAVLVLGVFGAYFYKKQEININLKGAVKSASSQKVQDISPGRSRAVLVLSDGSTVELDAAQNGMIAEQLGSAIKKIDEGRLVYESLKSDQVNTEIAYNKISIPRGGEYQLTLPDGSKVWLNSASSIRFPTTFSKTERKVEITGEAYFEVAKDTNRPFYVVSAHQTIEVLGTHFNVNAYDDEYETRTTLLEGSVKISQQSVSRLLVPGQQSLVGDGGSKPGINIVPADLESAVAWKNGYFKFDRESIQSIMRQVSRWYDVDVEFRGTIPQDEFVGKIKRNSNISGVLKILELSDIKCRVEGRKIIIDN